MVHRIGSMVGTLVLAALLSACAAGPRGNGPSADQTRLTAQEIASVSAQNLYEVVQRLRPRWIEVRAPRSGFSGEGTSVVVYLDRTLLGGPGELANLGPEVAAWIEYMSGSKAAAELPGIHSRHVEGAIIVHTASR